MFLKCSMLQSWFISWKVQCGGSGCSLRIEFIKKVSMWNHIQVSGEHQKTQHSGGPIDKYSYRGRSACARAGRLEALTVGWSKIQDPDWRQTAAFNELKDSLDGTCDQAGDQTSRGGTGVMGLHCHSLLTDWSSRGHGGTEGF